MQRKSIKHFAAGICLLFTSLFYCLSANADVLEGTSGQTLSGEYAVIINTDTSASQETGTLVFDDGDSTSSYSSAAATSCTGSFTSYPSGNSLSADNTPASSPDSDSAFSLPTSSVTYQIGEEKSIHGSNSSGKTYICIGIGEHCYIWMDKTMKSDYDAAGKTSLIAKDMAEVYDGQPYRILNDLADGSIPYEDNSRFP